MHARPVCEKSYSGVCSDPFEVEIPRRKRVSGNNKGVSQRMVSNTYRPWQVCCNHLEKHVCAVVVLYVYGSLCMVCCHDVSAPGGQRKQNGFVKFDEVIEFRVHKD